MKEQTVYALDVLMLYGADLSKVYPGDERPDFATTAQDSLFSLRARKRLSLRGELCTKTKILNDLPTKQR